MQVHTPILLIWFNRPQLARPVIDRLRPMQPALLFVAIDGPRENHATDAGQVAQSRALLNAIDWPCTLETRVLSENQGCKRAVSAAIDWLFEQVDEGIILEDDCLPDPSFVPFCTELLAHYRDDERVMHISGANLYGGHVWGNASYFFSRIPHVWGWASWRRAWRAYDVTMPNYPAFEQVGGIGRVVSDKRSARYWRHVLRATHNGTIDTWDYQWTYAVWQQGGLCITPNQNLVTNIGFGRSATHTTIPSPFANLPTKSLAAISHPAVVQASGEAMQYAAQHLYRPPSWLGTKVARLKQLLTTES